MKYTLYFECDGECLIDVDAVLSQLLATACLASLSYLASSFQSLVPLTEVTYIASQLASADGNSFSVMHSVLRTHVSCSSELQDKAVLLMFAF